MKATFLFLLAFLPFFGFAQNDTLLLLPQLGKEYIYEYTESEYTLKIDSSRFDPLERGKTLKIQFNKFEPEKEPYLLVTVEKNLEVRPEAVPLQITDYKFPAFVDKVDVGSNHLLCIERFKFSIDSATSQITLLNRTELLLSIRKILREKGFEDEDVIGKTEAFNEIMIPVFEKQVQSLFKVPVISLEEGSDVNEYNVGKDDDNNVRTVSQKRRSVQTGLYSREIQVDLKEDHLMASKSIEIDSIKRNSFRSNLQKGNLLYRETNVALKRVSDLDNRKVRIFGKVEKLLSKKVILSKLQKSYGLELQQQVIYCDADNSFEIETELEQPQLIFLQFGQSVNQRGLPTLLLYAEPGSEIHLDASGDYFPWDITFSGDHTSVQKMIYEYRTKYPIFDERLRSNFYMWIGSDDRYREFEKIVNGFDEICNKYKYEIPKEVFDFVKTEFRNQLYIGVWEYLTRIYAISHYGYSPYPFPDGIDEEFLKAYGDLFNINLDFNPYGIFSRLASMSYFQYCFSSGRKVMESSYSSPTFSVVRGSAYIYDLPIEVEFAKTILAGAPLYNVLAYLLIDQSRRYISFESKNELPQERRIDDYLGLMVRLCNDERFSKEISAFVSAQSKWSSDEYVPDAKFLNQAGKEVSMKDFLGEKPTIFYVSEDWAADRYGFDDVSVENRDINYVMVVEGSNFKEWTDYNKAAEAKANQLLFISEKEHLTDIFEMASRTYILFDKAGKRIGYAKSPKEATKLIRKDMEQPKEKTIDKSALITVIIVLVALLVLVVSVLLVWKWRVQQQFRKEQRERRLRELELTAIRSQMNPHFLFNSLNSVQNLVQKNMGREAHLYLSDFAGLIRKVLNNSEKEEVSLAEELEMTEQYLRLEQLRFDFGYSMEIDSEIDVHNTLVPSMLLQPFVENAIVHGLQNKTSDRKLKITMKRRDSEIKIEIEDNGVGREAAKELSKTKNGKGSKLISERLQLLKEKQGEKYSLETIDLPEGTRVEIIIPEEN